MAAAEIRDLANALTPTANALTELMRKETISEVEAPGAAGRGVTPNPIPPHAPGGDRIVRRGTRGRPRHRRGPGVEFGFQPSLGPGIARTRDRTLQRHYRAVTGSSPAPRLGRLTIEGSEIRVACEFS